MLDYAADFVFKDGKITKTKIGQGKIFGEGHSHDYVKMLHNNKALMLSYYEKSSSEDKCGQKAYTTGDQQTLKLKYNRISTAAMMMPLNRKSMSL